MQLNYPLLIATHVACVDGQLHKHEVDLLNGFAVEAAVDETTLDAMRGILSGRDGHVTLDQAIAGIRLDQVALAFELSIYVAHADLHIDAKESKLIQRLREHWKIDGAKVEAMQASVRGEFLKSREAAGASADDGRLGGMARLVRGVDAVFSRRVVDSVLAKVGAEHLIRSVEDYRSQVLLAGPAYEEAIKRCQVIGEQDICVADRALEDSQRVLMQLLGQIRKGINAIERAGNNVGGESASHVLQQLREDQRALTTDVAMQLREIVALQEKKRRSIRYFTLSFMGKSKAGKSTLHAVITGEGWDAIGEGKQNTTRHNRVYEWKDLRIIDTPGVAAPDGKAYEQIAESIIDESDLMCWVLTDNNQQESEFRFLRKLKEKGKPLVILLNVQYNLEHPRRLKQFLDDPNALFSNSENVLGGHFARIRQYASQFYGDAEVPIIPIQLLAARLAHREKDPRLASRLMEASRLESFLNEVRTSLIREGQVRRSQNLLGSTVSDLERPLAWARSRADVYRRMQKTLRRKRTDTDKLVSRMGTQYREQLTTAISVVFEELKGRVTTFAEAHWDSKEIALNKAWARVVKVAGSDAALSSSYETAMRELKGAIETALNEVGRDLQLTSKLEEMSVKLNEQDARAHAHNVAKWGSAATGIAGGVLVILELVSGPVGWAIAFGSTLLGLAAMLLQTKAQKKIKAIAKISQALTGQLERQQEASTKKLLSVFDAQCATVAVAIAAYFDQLADGAATMGGALDGAAYELLQRRDLLNRCYAFRIVDWARGEASTLDTASVNREVLEVERKIGISMSMKLLQPQHMTLELDRASRAVQEAITLIPGAPK